MNLSVRLLVALCFLPFCSCYREKWVIYVDELSEAYAAPIIQEYRQKYPQKDVQVYTYNTDFIFQSIKMGRKPDVVVSFDTAYAQKFGLSLPFKKLIARDALVLVVADTSLSAIQDVLVKGKTIALPMQNNALFPYVANYLKFQNLNSESLAFFYPHDFKSMRLYLQRRLASAGVMLKSQADYHRLRSRFPYFQRSFLHYQVELSP